jgi:hypothetical protein
MEPTSALSVLSLMDTTKAQRATFVQSVVQDLKDGNSDPLKVHKQVKCVEDLITQLKDDPEYKGIVLLEAEKHGKTHQTSNAVFSVVEVGTKYDYSQCNDSVYFELIEKFEFAQNALKQRETFLKGLIAKGIDIVTEHGELATIYPPTKTSTTSVKVTLK